jgi:cell division topological specificity factor
MSSLLKALLGGGRPTSSQIAKERLQLVLVHDRSNLTPEQVEAMKDEILEVIAKYVDFDRDKVEINLTSNNRESMLLAEIPIQPGTGRRPRATPAPLADA